MMGWIPDMMSRETAWAEAAAPLMSLGNRTERNGTLDQGNDYIWEAHESLEERMINSWISSNFAGSVAFPMAVPAHRSC